MTVETSGYNILQGQVSASADSSQQIAILFDYIADETSTVEAEITDNWVESNYSIQDHIAIKPRIYRLRGYVGEVIFEDKWSILENIDNFASNHPVFNKTKDVVNGISSISGVASNYTRAAINITKQVESSYDRYKNIWKNFTQRNIFANKRQKSVYAILMHMLQNRIPVKLTSLMFTGEYFVEGQYDKLYYLQNVSAHQGDNAYISDIEVTIKEFRIATTKTTKLDKSKYSGMIASQKTSEANNGLAKGDVVKTSLAELKNKSGGTITETTPKNPIKKFFWNVQKQNAEYNKSINDFYYYSVDYRK